MTLSEQEVENLLHDLILDWFVQHPQTRRRDMPANIARNLARDLARLRVALEQG